jgi:hypothetical protein
MVKRPAVRQTLYLWSNKECGGGRNIVSDCNGGCVECSDENLRRRESMKNPDVLGCSFHKAAEGSASQSHKPELTLHSLWFSPNHRPKITSCLPCLPQDRQTQFNFAHFVS